MPTIPTKEFESKLRETVTRLRQNEKFTAVEIRGLLENFKVNVAISNALDKTDRHSQSLMDIYPAKALKALKSQDPLQDAVTALDNAIEAKGIVGSGLSTMVNRQRDAGPGHKSAEEKILAATIMVCMDQGRGTSPSTGHSR